jgi:hypothetical protein
MMFKGAAICAVLLAIMQAPAQVSGQAANQADANRQTASPSTSSNTAPQSTSSPTAKAECEGVSCDTQQPRITIANPAPLPASWPLHDRIAWAANLVLVLVGYAGIMLAISTLRKIERQTKYAEAAAEAAAECARAALSHAQAILHSERPWILITVEPSRTKENSYSLMAANRGRTPARIVDATDRSQIAIDEKLLPGIPVYMNEERSAPFTPLILLPGESTAIRQFSRDDVKGLCDSEERFKRIETWDEKVFLYGKVIYKDLIAPADSLAHETNWCYWYIHGRHKSGLVIAGPPEYNLHT